MKNETIDTIVKAAAYKAYTSSSIEGYSMSNICHGPDESVIVNFSIRITDTDISKFNNPEPMDKK